MAPGPTGIRAGTRQQHATEAAPAGAGGWICNLQGREGRDMRFSKALSIRACCLAEREIFWCRLCRTERPPGTELEHARRLIYKPRSSVFAVRPFFPGTEAHSHFALPHQISHPLTLTESIMGDRTVLAPELFLIVLVVSSEAG